MNWLMCQGCRRVHPAGARHLMDHEKAEAVSFPCYWGWDYAGGSPYLVFEAVARDPQALLEAEAEWRRRRDATIALAEGQ